MRRTLKYVLPFVLAVVAVSSSAQAPLVNDSSFRASDGSRVLEQSIEISASAERSWEAFATTDGWKAWGAPVASVDLRLGGIIESSYDGKERLGSSHTIKNRITAFAPGRVLAFVTEQAPANTQFDVATFRTVQTIILFEPLGHAKTRVRIIQSGYGSGDKYDGVYKFFRWGNGYTLQELKRHLEKPVRVSAK